MSPETLETRFAELRQRVSDFIDMTLERFRTTDEQLERRFRQLDDDIRAFAPLIRDVDRLRDGQQRNNDRLAEMANKVDAIHKRLDDREQEKRQSNRQLWFILVGVLASSLGGLLVNILNVGVH